MEGLNVKTKTLPSHSAANMGHSWHRWCPGLLTILYHHWLLNRHHIYKSGHVLPIAIIVHMGFTYIHTYIHTYVRTYVHTYIRMYIRTYIHQSTRINYFSCSPCNHHILLPFVGLLCRRRRRRRRRRRSALCRTCGTCDKYGFHQQEITTMFHCYGV